MTSSRLTLTALGAGAAAYPRTGPMPLVVALRNASPTPIWVNARMGMGYEDGLVRELYFTVYDAEGTLLPVPDGARVDVHRLPPRRQDFMELAAGGAVETTVDASFWYPFPHSGRFSIVFTYENRWAGHEFGVEAFTGTVSAPALSVAVE
jgi:hypothetical protein